MRLIDTKLDDIYIYIKNIKKYNLMMRVLKH